MIPTPATGLKNARQKMGGSAAIARLFGITRGAVAQWERIPAQRVQIISDSTGLQPHELRPDIFRAPSQQEAVDG